MLRAAAGVLPGVDCAAAAETDKQNPAAVSSNTMTRTPRAVAHLLLPGFMRRAPSYIRGPPTPAGPIATDQSGIIGAPCREARSGVTSPTMVSSVTPTSTRAN